MTRTDIVVQRARPGTALVSLIGEHDAYTAAKLSGELAALLAEEVDVIVDLRQATFVDSQTLSVLLTAQRRAKERSLGYVLVVSADDYTQVHRILDMTRLTSAFVVRPTLQTTRDDRIFAIGDCAACAWQGRDRQVPPRAQAAHQQASHVLKQIRRQMRGQPLAVMALYADGPSTLRNIASWRVKETDRLAAMATELRKLGAQVEEGADFLRVTPPAQWTAASIHTYDDHRVAMCFSLAAFNALAGAAPAVPVRIDDPKCVAKTFPHYFETLFSVAATDTASIPVLAIDVYGHAYVRDFGATPDGRGEYVEAFFRNLDWDHVNRQLEQAEAARAGAESVGREPKG